jgi:ubiquinone/menaquinone biosynthesis C-methylase UbiE
MSDRAKPPQKTIGISAGHALLRQCSKPSGWFGRFNLWRMNRSHSALTDWGLSHIAVQPGDNVLDVGCGGGRTIAKLDSKASRGRVFGVDYSADSVATARKTNRAAVDAGRVEILQASVSALPFPSAIFDVVTAVETHYYWPDLVEDLREVLRVLKPAGRFVLIAEAYKGGKYDAVLRRMELLEQRGIMKYAHLTVEEHRQLLSAAGYADVQAFEEYDKGWLCVTGRKHNMRP